MADSQSSSAGSGNNGSDMQPPVRAADIVETERSIQVPPQQQQHSASTLGLLAAAADCVPLCGAVQSLQAQLDRAYEVGDVAGSGLLAQQIAQFKQQLRAQRQQVAANREREKEEREWESAQLSKINGIKAVVEERRRETEQLQRAIRQLLTGQQRQQQQQQQQQQASSGHGSTPASSAAASFFSVFSSKDGPSHSHSHSHGPTQPHSPPPLPLDETLQRARKSIKETQVTLEKQTLIVDSVDMNEHPSTLHATAALPSASLASIKAIRKDTVQLIQSHLSHVDELERHIDALDACLTFLDHHIGPTIQRPPPAASSSQRHIRQQQQQQQQQPNSNGPMR